MKYQCLIGYGPRLKTSRTSSTIQNIVFLRGNFFQNQSSPKDVTYIFSYRMIANFVYDISFLKRRKLIIDGDVESNPGPVSSVESYRAAIGRHNGKFKSRENVTAMNGKHLTLLDLPKGMVLFSTSVEHSDRKWLVGWLVYHKKL